MGCGSNRPGRIGMKSLIGRPNRHMAGETLVSGSGVLRYCNIAILNASVFRVPRGEVLDVIIRFRVFTPISARQFEWGNATDDCRWWMPHVFMKFLVAGAVNSDPPSVASSSGIPNVINVCLSTSIRPFDPPHARSTIGQLE